MQMFYQVGGSLGADAPSYVERQADVDLYQGLRQGEFCYVLDSRQMGKSSLMVQMWHRLQREGDRCFVLDVTNLGTDQTTASQWYMGMISALLTQCDEFTEFDVLDWWQQHHHLSLIQSLSQFMEVLLATFPQQHIFVFVDEIDSVLNLEFPVDDFFAWIRFCYNQRSLNAEYHRLAFAIFGVATPSDLIRDKQRTPFNIGKAITLSGFQLQDVQPLAQGLQTTMDNQQAILQSVLHWTGGQPFLTQKLCRILVTSSQSSISDPLQIPAGMESYWVDNMARSHIVDRWESQDEPEHLRTIRDRLLYDETQRGRLLGLYQRLLEGETIPCDDSRDQINLLLCGLVVKEAGWLRIKNRIYEQVFNLLWVQRQLADLRPYSEAFEAWMVSKQTDESRLLRGQALQDAQDWAKGKSLSDQDYRFLAISQEQERWEMQRSLELEKAQAAKRTTRLQRILLIIVSIAFVLVSLAGLVGFYQYQRAIASEQTARINELKALVSSSEGQFSSFHDLEALVDALKSKRSYDALRRDHVPLDDSLAQAVDAVLTRSAYWSTEFNQLSGHQGTVLGVAFSPDGDRLATASNDRTVKLWQLDGTLLASFDTNSTAFGVAFHPTQPLLAATNLDGSVQIWNLDTKQLVNEIIAHDGACWDVIFSPDGTSLFTGGADALVKQWDIEGNLQQTFSGHDEMIWRVAISADGQRIASSSVDTTIRVWNLDGEPLQVLSTEASAWSVDFDPQGDWIVSDGENHTVKLWNLDGSLHQVLNGHTKRLEHAIFNPDGTAIASGGLDRTVRLWGRDGSLWRILEKSNTISELKFSPTPAPYLVALSDAVMLLRWENDLLKTYVGNGTSWDIALSPDGSQIITGAAGTIVVRDRDRQPVFSLTNPDGSSLFGFAYSPDGQWIATTGQQGATLLWDTNGNLVRSLIGHTFQVWDAAFNHDSTLIASISEDGTTKIWQTDGTLLHTLQGHDGRGYGVAFNPQTDQLATSGADGKILIWNRDGSLAHRIDAHDSDIFGLAASPDGQFIASASVDRTAKLWRWDGTLVQTFTGHTDELFDIAFSPDSQTVATASTDKTVKLWALDGTEIKTLYNDRFEFRSVGFSSDGEMLVTGESTGRVILWNLPKVLDFNAMAYICEQIDDYLKTNINVDESDRSLCSLRN